MGVAFYGNILHCLVNIFSSKIFSAGYSLTYFTIDSVFPLVVLSVGGSHGLGFIFVYAIAIGTAQKWFPENMKG